jgi:hypothetical protein
MNEVREMSRLHTDMKVIDQKVTERAISKVSDHYFSICIFNEVERDDECLNIREVI